MVRYVRGEQGAFSVMQKLSEDSVGSQMVRSTHAPTDTNTRSFKVKVKQGQESQEFRSKKQWKARRIISIFQEELA